LGIVAATLVYREIVKDRDLVLKRGVNSSEVEDIQRLEEAELFLKRSSGGSSFMGPSPPPSSYQGSSFSEASPTLELPSKRAGSFMKEKGRSTGDRVKTFGPNSYHE
jgi:hypothetical protein